MVDDNYHQSHLYGQNDPDLPKQIFINNASAEPLLPDIAVGTQDYTDDIRRMLREQIQATLSDSDSEKHAAKQELSFWHIRLASPVQEWL